MTDRLEVVVTNWLGIARVGTGREDVAAAKVEHDGAIGDLRGPGVEVDVEPGWEVRVKVNALKGAGGVL